MSEETPAILTDPLAEPGKVHLALGAALRTARERMKLEVEEVAQQLKMSAYQVKALEQDNHSVLPAPTFVRGFIRNYARLLQMDAAPLLDAYYEMLPESSHKNSITLELESIPITNPAQKSFRLYLMVSVLLVVFGGGWWQYMEWSEKQAKVRPVQAEAVLPKPVKQAEPAPAPAPIPQMQSFQAESVPASAPTPESAPAAAPVRATTPNSIRMTFSEQSWVSVADASGKEVFNKTSAAETEEVVNGTPPFNVVIGNAVGVQVFYKGQAVDVASHSKANVARLTLE